MLRYIGPMHRSDAQVYLLAKLKNQISITRSIEIVNELKLNAPDLLSISDYAAISNALLDTGQLQRAEEFAMQGLELSSDPIVRIYLTLHTAKIQYADDRTSDARATVVETLTMLTESRDMSEMEKVGFRSLILAAHAHIELDLGNPTAAQASIVASEEAATVLPMIDRGMRWRANRLISSFRQKAPQAGDMPAAAPAEPLYWKYVNQLAPWTSWISSEKELDKHKVAYERAQRRIFDSPPRTNN